MARIELDEVMQGLGLLGNVLSIPQQIGNQQIQNEQTRLLLKDSGLPPEMIAAATPEPSMRWLSAHQPGFGGKVLGGVGDVGSILTTVVGKPIKAPRLELSDLAAASTLRTKHAQELAKARLGAVILDPKSTNKDIAAAAIESGDTNEALRLLRRGGDSGKPPASVLGLRGMIESMDPDDPRRPQYQRALDAQLTYERQRRDEENQAIIERQPPHYDPGTSWQMQHEAQKKQWGLEADKLGLKGADRDYYMSYGHPRVERQAAPEPTFEQDVQNEQRRRDALSKNPRTAKTIPNEPVEDTVRRQRAMRAAGKAAEKSGLPIPEPPPPKPKPEKPAEPPTQPGLLSRLFGGGGETPTSTTETPTSTTTSTTQDPEAAADAILGSIDLDSLPPDVQQQVHDAAAAGMPKWSLANWLLSLTTPSSTTTTTTTQPPR